MQTHPNVFTFFTILISKIASCLIVEIEIVTFWLDLQILLMKSAKNIFQQQLPQLIQQLQQQPQLLQQQQLPQLLLQLLVLPQLLQQLLQV